MPFKSKAQMKYMFKNHPDIANRWKNKYGVKKNMPIHVKKVVKKRQSGSK
jgi:hypothetical protein